MLSCHGPIPTWIPCNQVCLKLPSVLRSTWAFRAEVWSIVDSNRNAPTINVFYRVFFNDAKHLKNFPNMRQLILVMLMIPVQTACVERGFSLHRVIKNRLRNRLKVATIDSLLRVFFLAPRPLKSFPFEKAVCGFRIGVAPVKSLVGQLSLKASQLMLPDFDVGMDSDDEFAMPEDDERTESDAEIYPDVTDSAEDDTDVGPHLRVRQSMPEGVDNLENLSDDEEF